MTWEQRWHPLREEWVVVAAHRQTRPWRGERTAVPTASVPRHDPDCQFCPGNARVSGVRNPDYRETLAFDNDAPCVGSTAPVPAPAAPPFENRAATGISRVVCYTPRHDLSLSRLSRSGAMASMRTLADQYTELAERPEVAHVLVFENRGEAVGVSNPHPHCQIYATNFVFATIEREAAVSARFHAERGHSLLSEIVDAEVADGRRVVFENEHAVAFVPYFARYPYETYVAPRRAHRSLAELTPEGLEGFTEALQQILVRYDNLWRMPFPYVLALHQAPTDGGELPGFHFHAELHPPLRKPDLRKYAAGPEIGGGNYLMDVMPEDTAAELRGAAAIHYLDAEERP